MAKYKQEIAISFYNFPGSILLTNINFFPFHYTQKYGFNFLALIADRLKVACLCLIVS